MSTSFPSCHPVLQLPHTLPASQISHNLTFVYTPYIRSLETPRHFHARKLYLCRLPLRIRTGWFIFLPFPYVKRFLPASAFPSYQDFHTIPSSSSSLYTTVQPEKYTRLCYFECRCHPKFMPNA